MALLDRARRLGLPAALAGLLAGVLGVIWALWLARDAGDLAAQYAWSSFARHHPGSAYNLSWYGGIHPASYSVISPYLMAFVGVRTTGVIACVATAAMGGFLITLSGVKRPLLPALWLAVAVWGNLATGRITYLLGMGFAMGAAALTLPRTGSPTAEPGSWPIGRRSRRVTAAAVLGVVATLCSPVAGLFIEVLAAALFLGRRRKTAYLLAAGPPVVIAATSLLFPFSGVQPFPWYSALLTVAAGVVVALLSPPAWRTVRAGAWVYAAGVTLCWLLPTPIGSNVERLALLISAAVLVCAAVVREGKGWRTKATYVAATGLAVWTLVQPAIDIAHTPPAKATVADARPLLAELRVLGAEQGRVEVVPLHTHWEASGVAPYVDLARGWNRQADVQRNPLFYDGTLTAASYRTWLSYWSVGYVVLPTAEPDTAGIAEAQLINAGQSWLPLVWSDTDWRVYKVADTDPIASAPANATYAGPAALTVHVPHAGTTLLRIAWSPWLAIAGQNDETALRACLAQNGPWTELIAPAAGTYTIEAHYSLERGTPCPTTPVS